MSSPSTDVSPKLPAVDERLIAPETGYEIDDGKLVAVVSSDENHAVPHGAIGALLRAHRRDEYEVAIDMLMRSSEQTDAAPDASVYPRGLDPVTNGRRLEELAFEVLATERLGHAATKAEKLIARGVRRVFAVDVVKRRAFEWSRELGTWALLAPAARLEDAALAVALPVAALVDAAVADDATVRAFRAKRHPEFLAERAEGRAEGRTEGRTEGRVEMLRKQLLIKFSVLAPEDEARLAEATIAALDRYAERTLTATTLAEVFGE